MGHECRIGLICATSALPPDCRQESGHRLPTLWASNERVRLRLVSFDEQEMDEARPRVATASYLGALELVFEIEVSFRGYGLARLQRECVVSEWPIDRQSIPRLSARPLIV